MIVSDAYRRWRGPRGPVFPVLPTLVLVALAATSIAAPASAGADRTQDSPTVLTRAVRDLDGDGRADTLRVVMTGGRIHEDTAAWCGAGRKAEGSFELVLRLAAGDESRLGLEDFTFFRAGDWRIRFADYDGDDRLDFNLGQYGTCNGWRYRLFTVRPSGTIERLPVPGGWLSAGDFSNSTDRIRPVEGGFRVCYYSNATGHTAVRYAWDPEQETFVEKARRRVDRCSPGEGRDTAR